MTGILKVDTIQSSGGTTGLTIDSSGRVDMANTIMYDVYRLTGDVSATGTITAWESPDDAMAATVGDSMSVSSGIFTFPRTGVYKVGLYARIDNEDGDTATACEIQGTIDNSTYDTLAFLQVSHDSSATYVRATCAGEAVVNISDVANRKIRIEGTSITSPSLIMGQTDYNATYVTFQYLAPAQ